MSHRVPVTFIGDFVTTDWYLNSMQPLKEMVRQGVIDQTYMFDSYQVAYGVRLHFDHQGWLTHVEFPSRERATEFILRWS